MGWGTGDDERSRATTPPRLAVIVTATLLGGLIAAVAVIGSNALEPRLADAARSALRDAGIEGVQVRFDGREAFLTAGGATEAQLAAAERVVEKVDGVRWATVVRPDPASQPVLTVTEDAAGVVTVTGTLGTGGQASAVQDAAAAAFGPATIRRVTVSDGVAVASWADATPRLFAALAQVGDIRFELGAEGATLSGSAADPAAVVAEVSAALNPIPVSAALQQAGPTEAEAATINGTVILFVADSVTLDQTARDRVAGLADALRRFPTIGVTLTGHIAIPVGTEADAIAFSRERAQAVADALIADGIDAARIATDGAGSSQPVGDNATAAGAAANRRVTVLIMEGS